MVQEWTGQKPFKSWRHNHFEPWPNRLKKTIRQSTHLLKSLRNNRKHGRIHQSTKNQPTHTKINCSQQTSYFWSETIVLKIWMTHFHPKSGYECPEWVGATLPQVWFLGKGKVQLKINRMFILQKRRWFTNNLKIYPNNGECHLPF